MAAAIVFLLTLTAASLGYKKQPPIVVNGPTVIAFFGTVSDVDLKKSPDLHESLADFQLYAKSLKKTLAERGIRFYELNAASFRIKIGTRNSTFRVGKEGVGYYLIAPDKQPRVERGVMTDSDLLRVVDDYFAKAKTGTP